MIHRVGYLPEERLAPLLQRGAGLHIPLFGVEGPSGLDGETTTLEAGDMWSGGHLHWWCDGPAAWRAIINWAAELGELLERAVLAPPTPA
jgi:hypothetical protein